MGWVLLILGVALWWAAHFFKRLMPERRAAMGDAGKGAAAGAVRGRRMGREAQAQAQQQAAEQAEQREQATEQEMANFKKAFSVCLEAKNYMVKY